MAISDELEEAVEPSLGTWGHVQVLYEEGITLILLSGEIDLALGPELEAATRAAIDRPQQVRLDVSRVSFIDSAGLGLMARLASAPIANGRPVTVIGASQRTRETISMAGLAALVEYAD